MGLLGPADVLGGQRDTEFIADRHWEDMEDNFDEEH